MKMLTTFLLLIPFFSIGQTTVELDEKNGYKDIAFSMPFDSVQAAIKARRVDNSSDLKIYEIRESKYQKISDIAVQPKIGVFDNRIIYISLTVYEWKKHEDVLVKMFTELYGPPVKQTSIEDTYIWDGLRSRLTVTESYSYDYGMIFIESKDNDSYRQEIIKEKAKKKASDF